MLLAFLFESVVMPKKKTKTKQKFLTRMTEVHDIQFYKR